MKLVLKTLLITTVLTLPSLFGANSALTQDAAPPSSTGEFNGDVRQIITGNLQDTNGEIGFSGLPALQALAGLSKAWYNAAQPMIDAANEWRRTNFISRVLGGNMTPVDREMCVFLGYDPGKSPFDLILAMLTLTKKSRVAEILPEQIQGLVAQVQGSSVTSDQKTILKVLIRYPDVSAEHLSYAAQAFQRLGLPEDAIAALKLMLDHPDLLPENLSGAAETLERLGLREDAIAALRLMRDRPNVSADYLAEVARAFESLGRSGEAAAALELMLDHLDRSPRYLSGAAETLERLELREDAIAASRLMLARPNVSAGFFDRAAETPERLGLRESTDAAWERVRNRTAGAAETLEGFELPEEVEVRKLGFPDLHSLDFALAAQAFESLGLLGDAIAAWTRIKDDPQASRQDRETAVDALIRLQTESN